MIMQPCFRVNLSDSLQIRECKNNKFVSILNKSLILINYLYSRVQNIVQYGFSEA